MNNMGIDTFISLQHLLYDYASEATMFSRSCTATLAAVSETALAPVALMLTCCSAILAALLSTSLWAGDCAGCARHTASGRTRLLRPKMAFQSVQHPVLTRIVAVASLQQRNSEFASGAWRAAGIQTVGQRSDLCCPATRLCPHE